MASVRARRDFARGQRAAAAKHDAAGSALEIARARIEAVFSSSIRHSIFKDRVADLIGAGAEHPKVCTRYRRIAECHPAADLDAAIAAVERARRRELAARERAIRAWGRCSRPRIALMVLDEVRLILRLLRRFAPARYRAIHAAVLTADLRSSRETHS